MVKKAHHLQEIVDGAKVKQLTDPLTGLPLHVAVYGRDAPKRRLDVLQFLPINASLTYLDRVAQGAALTHVLGARVVQVTHQGFRGSGLSIKQAMSSARGDFTPHAKSIEATLQKDGPEGFALARALLVGESIGGVVAAHMAAATRTGNIALIDSGSMEEQLSVAIILGMFREAKQFGSQRKALVDGSVEGLVLPEFYKPTPKGVAGRLPLNPVAFPLMLSPGFSTNSTTRRLHQALSSNDELLVSGRVAEHSQLFPAVGAAAQYARLQAEFGPGRVVYDTVPNVSHYTITADATRFAEMVAQQAVEVAML